MQTAEAIQRAKEVAEKTLAPAAAKNDKEGRFSTEAVSALGSAGLLGLVVSAEAGGAGLGPRAFAEVTATLAEADASVAMVYMMHVSATMCLVTGAKSPAAKAILGDIGRGKHLTTLAFSEKGSRSHFWAPISKAQRAGSGVRISALKSWVTSADHADSYVVSALQPDSKGPTDTTLYLVKKGAAGVKVSGPWDGMGLRGNASAPMTLEAAEVGDDLRLTEDGAGFKAMLEVVLPWFNLGQAAVGLGICRASVGATVSHLKSSVFEHMNKVSLGEALPNLRAQLAQMQIDTDGLAARVTDTVANLESPGPLTMLRVLESKAAANETAIRVTSDAMRTCGGAAFSKHTGIERYFRDAHAGAVMAPTVDQLRDFMGKALLGIPLF
ncbi:MAG TPA: acyl-CoA dehydrogenase family protein [Polyangiaceae bacterium]